MRWLIPIALVAGAALVWWYYRDAGLGAWYGPALLTVGLLGAAAVFALLLVLFR